MKLWKIFAAALAACIVATGIASADSLNGNVAGTSLSSSVTGSSSQQTFNVGNSVGCSAGAIALVGGFASELTKIIAVPNSTSLTAILQYNHTYGDPVYCVIGVTGNFSIPTPLPVTFPSAQPVTFSTPVPVVGATAVGAAVSGGPVFGGGEGNSGALQPFLICNSSAAISVSNGSTTVLVAISAGKSIYVCNFNIMANGATTASLGYETGSSCSGYTAMTGAYPLTAQAGISVGIGIGAVLVVPSGDGFCISEGSAVQVSGSISYAQF